MCKKILKKLCALSLIFLISFSMISCAKSASLDVDSLASTIKKVGSFSELSALSRDKLSSYFAFNDSSTLRFKVLISSSGESTDTIAIFETADNEQKSDVIQGVSPYLTNLSASFKNTKKAEFTKIENRLFYELGKIVILVISGNNEPIKEELESLGAVAIH